VSTLRGALSLSSMAGGHSDSSARYFVASGRRVLIIFVHSFFSSDAFLNLYPALSTSPVLETLDWSLVVHTALQRNIPQLFPDLAHLASSPENWSRDVLAVHVRRGDFAEHCSYLADRRIGWMGMNAHPALRHNFVIPPGSSDNSTTEEENVIKEIYRRRCLPTASEIAERVPHGTKNVYILTDAPSSFVRDISRALGPDVIVRSGFDLVLTRKERELGAAVDMALAERAKTFVGNGVRLLFLAFMALCWRHIETDDLKRSSGQVYRRTS
jgi:hypothetical protein